MAFWGVEVKPGKPYVHESSRRGRLRITQATLGNCENVGWSAIVCSVGGMMPVRLCALNSTLVTYRLDLEYDEGENVVFSVIGDGSVHLAGYYKIPDAAASVQTPVTQSQEAGDGKTAHAYDITQERNALETEMDTDGTDQMVGQAGLNNVKSISDEASLGSGNHPASKEDVGSPIHELGIEELKLGDCNAEMASEGKKVHVKYIGMLEDGKVVDSLEGRCDTHKFVLGAGKVIDGWEQGIKGMRVGGKRKLTIPPALGYKDEPQGEIPANSWLIYEVELIKVSKPKKKSRSAKHH